MNFLEFSSNIRSAVNHLESIKDTVGDFLKYVDSKDETIMALLNKSSELIPFEPYKIAVKYITEYEPKVLKILLDGISLSESVSLISEKKITSEEKLKKAVNIIKSEMQSLVKAPVEKIHDKLIPDIVNDIVGSINFFMKKV